MTLSDRRGSGFPKGYVPIAGEKRNVEWEWGLFRHTPAGETKQEITANLWDDSVTATCCFMATE